MDLTTRVREVDGVPIVELHGEVDGYTSVSVRQIIFSLLDRGASNLIINLDGVRYVDSTGLGVMVGVLKRVKELNGHLCLTFSNPMIGRIFQLTGLNNLFTIRRTDQESAATLDQTKIRGAGGLAIPTLSIQPV